MRINSMHIGRKKLVFLILAAAPYAAALALLEAPPRLTNARVADFRCTCDDNCSGVGASLDGRPWAAANPHLLSFEGLEDGVHSLRLRQLVGVTDGAAEEETIEFSWTVDTAPPETYVSSGPTSEDDTSSPFLFFTFRCSEPPCHFRYQFDDDIVLDGSFVEGAPPANLSAVDGSGTATVALSAISAQHGRALNWWSSYVDSSTYAAEAQGGSTSASPPLLSSSAWDEGNPSDFPETSNSSAPLAVIGRASITHRGGGVLSSDGGSAGGGDGEGGAMLELRVFLQLAGSGSGGGGSDLLLDGLPAAVAVYPLEEPLLRLVVELPEAEVDPKTGDTIFSLSVARPAPFQVGFNSCVVMEVLSDASNATDASLAQMPSLAWALLHESTTAKHWLRSPYDSPSAHLFRVAAIDSAGNVDPTPAEWQWALGSAPHTSIDTAPVETTAASSALFGFSCLLPGGSSPQTQSLQAGGGRRSRRRQLGEKELLPQEDLLEERSWQQTETAETWACGLGLLDTCLDPTGGSKVAVGGGRYSDNLLDRDGRIGGSGLGMSRLMASSPAPAPACDYYFSLSGGDFLLLPPPGASNGRYVDVPGKSSGGGSGGNITAQVWMESKSYNSLFLGGLPDGDHKLQVYACVHNSSDCDDNPNEWRWSVDTAPPKTTIVKFPGSLLPSEFEFSANKPGSTFSCQLDALPWRPCPATAEFELVDGSHILTVVAADAAGRTDAASPTAGGSAAVASWEVSLLDTVARYCPMGQRRSGSATLEIAATYNGRECGAAVGCAVMYELVHAAPAPRGSGSSCVGAAGGGDGGGPLAGKISTFPANCIGKSGNDGGGAGCGGEPNDGDLSWRQLPDCTVVYTSVGNASGGGGTLKLERLPPGAYNLTLQASDRFGGVDRSPVLCQWEVVGANASNVPELRVTKRPPPVVHNTSAPGEPLSVEVEMVLRDSGQTQILSSDAAASVTYLLQGPGASTAWATMPRASTQESKKDANYENSERASGSGGAAAWRLELPELADGRYTLQLRGEEGGKGAGQEQEPRQASTSVSWAVSTERPALTAVVVPQDPSHSGAAELYFLCSTADCELHWSLDSGPWQGVGPADLPGGLLGSDASLSGSGADDDDGMNGGGGSSGGKGKGGSQAGGSGNGNDTLAAYNPHVRSAAVTALGASEPAFVLTLSGLGPGIHTMEVIPRRSTGYEGAVWNASWEIDLTRPETTVVGHPAVITASADASFNFSCGVAGVMPAAGCSYEFQMLRPLQATAGTTWYPTDNPVTFQHITEGGHVLVVRATDLSTGLADEVPVTFQWTRDATAPELQWLATPERVTGDTDVFFQFACLDSGISHPNATQMAAVAASPGDAAAAAAAAAAAVGSASPCTFEAWLDGSAPMSVVDTITLRQLGQGSHNLTVVATDGAGNRGKPRTVSWKVDSAMPRTILVATPPAVTYATSAHFTLVDTVGASWGNGYFEYQLDAAESIDKGGNGGDFAPWKRAAGAEIILDGLDDGNHTLAVRAVSLDGVGGVGGFAKDEVPQRYAWRVDTACPQTSMVMYPAAVTHLRSAELVVHGSDSSDGGGAGSGAAGFEYRRNGGEWTAVSAAGVLHLDNLEDGQQVLSVRALDFAGNVDASPATTAWIVDRAGRFGSPGVPTDAAVVGGNGRAHVSWTAPADDGGDTVSEYVVVATTALADISVQTVTNVLAEEEGAAAPTSVLVEGLTNGQVFSFRVVAVNAFGHSTPSLPSNQVLLYDPADPCGLLACGPQGSCFLRGTDTGGLIGYCVCRPGYSGADCSAHDSGNSGSAGGFAPSYDYVPGPWSPCDKRCGGGTMTRALRCSAYRDGQASGPAGSSSLCLPVLDSLARNGNSGSRRSGYDGYGGYNDASSDAKRQKQLLASLEEESCRPMHCMEGFLTVSLRLQEYYDDVCFNVAAQDAFYAGFALEVAQALLIGASRVVDVNATRTERSAEMAVQFAIAPGADKMDQPVDVVKAQLELQVQSPDSAFRRQGVWTPKVVPASLVVTITGYELPPVDVGRIAYNVIIVLIAAGAAFVLCAVYGAWIGRKRRDRGKNKWVTLEDGGVTLADGDGSGRGERGNVEGEVCGFSGWFDDDDDTGSDTSDQAKDEAGGRGCGICCCWCACPSWRAADGHVGGSSGEHSGGDGGEGEHDGNQEHYFDITGDRRGSNPARGEASVAGTAPLELSDTDRSPPPPCGACGGDIGRGYGSSGGNGNGRVSPMRAPSNGVAPLLRRRGSWSARRGPAVAGNAGAAEPLTPPRAPAAAV